MPTILVSCCLSTLSEHVRDWPMRGKMCVTANCKFSDTKHMELMSPYYSLIGQFSSFAVCMTSWMSNLADYPTMYVWLWDISFMSLISRRMNAELEAKTSELVKEAEELLVSKCVYMKNLQKVKLKSWATEMPSLENRERERVCVCVGWRTCCPWGTLIESSNKSM